MAKYGVGIIGAGWVAGEYVKVFRDHPETELVGICSRTPGKATALLRQHGVEAREYASVDELFDDERVEHHRVLHASRRAPRALRSSGRNRAAHRDREADRAHARGRARGPRGGREGRREDRHERRAALEPAVPDRAAADEGRRPRGADLGEADYWHPLKPIYPGYPYFITKQYGGSAVVAGGVHAVDILRFLGGEIVEVAAFSGKPMLNLDYEYDPNIIASLRFANGAIGKLSTIFDADTPYIFNCRLFGTEGTIINNEVYSSKHYPGSLGYWKFPTIVPDSAEVSTIRSRRRSSTSSSASRTTSSPMRRSSTPGSRWRSRSRWTSRRRRAASP